MLNGKVECILTNEMLQKAAIYERVSLTDFMKCTISDLNRFPSTICKRPDNSLLNLDDDDLLIELTYAFPKCFQDTEVNLPRISDDNIALLKRWPDFTWMKDMEVNEFGKPVFSTVDPWDVVNYPGLQNPVKSTMSRPSQVPFRELLQRAKENYENKYKKKGKIVKRTDFEIANEIGISPSHFSEMKRIPGEGKKVRPVSVAHLCGICLFLEQTPQEAFDLFHDCMTTNELTEQDLIGQALIICLDAEEYNIDSFLELALRAWAIFHRELPIYAQKSSMWAEAMNEARAWVDTEFKSEEFQEKYKKVAGTIRYSKREKKLKR